MSLAIGLFLSNNRIVVFLEQRENSNHIKYMREFSITSSSNIFSMRSDTFLLNDFANTDLKILFNRSFVKLIHYKEI